MENFLVKNSEECQVLSVCGCISRKSGFALCICVLFHFFSMESVCACLVRFANTYGLVPSLRHKYDAVPGALKPCSPLEHRYTFDFPSVTVIKGVLALFSVLDTKYRKLKV